MKIFRTLVPMALVITSFSVVHAEKVTLKQAIADKLVSVEISGSAADNSLYLTERKPVMEVRMTNLTSRDITVTVEPGQMLTPYEKDVQNMMVTQQVETNLAATETKAEQVYAMCCEKSDRSPSPMNRFKMGSMATGHLKVLAMAVAHYNYQTGAAQSAVWCITDDDDLSSISSSNPEEIKLLKNIAGNAQRVKNSHGKPTVNPSSSSSVFYQREDAIVQQHTRSNNLWINQE